MNCLCFECPLEDCSTPCPFGVHDEIDMNIDEYIDDDLKKRNELQEYRRFYYQANKDNLKAYSKAYYQAHKEKLKAYSKAYYRANKEEIKAYMENKYKVLEGR